MPRSRKAAGAVHVVTFTNSILGSSGLFFNIIVYPDDTERLTLTKNCVRSLGGWGFHCTTGPTVLSPSCPLVVRVVGPQHNEFRVSILVWVEPSASSGYHHRNPPEPVLSLYLYTSHIVYSKLILVFNTKFFIFDLCRTPFLIW